MPWITWGVSITIGTDYLERIALLRIECAGAGNQYGYRPLNVQDENLMVSVELVDRSIAIINSKAIFM